MKGKIVIFLGHFQVKPINRGQLGNEERNIKKQSLFGKVPNANRSVLNAIHKTFSASMLRKIMMVEF